MEGKQQIGSLISKGLMPSVESLYITYSAFFIRTIQSFIISRQLLL